MTITVLTSGGFDPLHIGHVRLMHSASMLGDRLIVILNSDEWLQRKKGYVFMPEAERLEIIRALRMVNHAEALHSSEPHVAEAILKHRPNVFAKGGDRRSRLDLPKEEIDACAAVGARIVFGVGGDKAQSSSELVNRMTRDL
jgi:D-beta-D-heptose 7-phosphate kinase/D-beta-D-heptose 1-phosphate adenosyltransferase